MYVPGSCMYTTRTLACSPAEYEVYINAGNSCVVYISFSFSLSALNYHNSIAFRLLYQHYIAFRLHSYDYTAFRLLYSKETAISTYSPSGKSLYPSGYSLIAFKHISIAFRLITYCLKTHLLPSGSSHRSGSSLIQPSGSVIANEYNYSLVRTQFGTGGGPYFKL